MERSPGIPEGEKVYDFHTVEYTLDMPASTKQKYLSEGAFHMGQNQKQNQVRLVNQ